MAFFDSFEMIFEKFQSHFWLEKPKEAVILTYQRQKFILLFVSNIFGKGSI